MKLVTMWLLGGGYKGLRGGRASPIIQGKRLFGPISLPVVYYETSFAAESPSLT